jgi:hypothetical protein
MFESASRLVGVYKVNHMVSPFDASFDLHVLTWWTDEECHGREQRLHHSTVNHVGSVYRVHGVGSGEELLAWVYHTAGLHALVLFVFTSKLCLTS